MYLQAISVFVQGLDYPDGQKPIIPKDDGLGVMLPAFVSRKFGFGMKLSVEDLLQEVNEYRQEKALQ